MGSAFSARRTAYRNSACSWPGVGLPPIRIVASVFVIVDGIDGFPADLPSELTSEGSPSVGTIPP